MIIKILKYIFYGLLIMLIIIAIYLTLTHKNVVNNGTDNDNESNTQTQGEKASEIAGNEDMLILANKTNELAQNYKPSDLSRVNAYASGRDDSTRYMRKEASDSMNKMLEDVKASGMDIVITTAYRSYNLQKIIFENNVKKSGSIEEANKTSAKPGQSEHQTGLAADLSSSKLDFELDTKFGELDEGKWISENSWKYGFILRYPKDKTEITGYSYEPWHVRYVGKEFAKFIKDNNLTLEEFILQRQQIN
ncbi:MAG: M15 family metallopeptidase [Eubacteriales bacterium]